MLIEIKLKQICQYPTKLYHKNFKLLHLMIPIFSFTSHNLLSPLPSSDNGILLGQSFTLSVKFRVLMDGFEHELVFSDVLPPHTASSPYCILPHCLLPTLLPPHTAFSPHCFHPTLHSPTLLPPHTAFSPHCFLPTMLPSKASSSISLFSPRNQNSIFTDKKKLRFTLHSVAFE